jgi:molybdopterin-guanine dinucleotide biosynthesis protein A
MGGEDKGLQLLKGKPLWQHVADTLVDHRKHAGQRPRKISKIILINGKPAALVNIDMAICAQRHFPGPLAGMLSVMQQSQGEWFLFCSCDTPFIPTCLRPRKISKIILINGKPAALVNIDMAICAQRHCRYLLSVMQQSQGEWFLFCSCDTPFIPTCLVERMVQQNQQDYPDKRETRCAGKYRYGDLRSAPLPIPDRQA